jgi:phosphoenolpyruvate-protein phosphotransferase (PTS system enzyme I)
MSETPIKTERRLHGIGVSLGVARAEVFVHRSDDIETPVRTITDADIPGEVARFEAALIETREQITEMQRHIAASIGSKDAGIFDAHLLVVEDSALIDEVLRKLTADKVNVEHAFAEVTGRYIRTLGEIDDPYLKERVVDIQDVSRRILHNLMGRAPSSLAMASKPHILIARDLTPSDTAQLNRTMVLGFATDVGSKTSHTAIMARSLNIPAIVGLHNATKEIETGDDVLLDGHNGLLIINPSEQTLEEYGQIERRKTEVERDLVTLRDTVSTTTDGRRIALSANIELPEEIEFVNNCGAEGVGLYRTEFLFLNKPHPPTEEEQFEKYRLVAEGVAPHSVIIRTLDLGGDKFMRSLELPEEMNPFLGWRAIRFCLENTPIFKAQLRAILRASAFGKVKIMYPMISGVDEFRHANQVLEECRGELRNEGVAFDEKMEVGAMIEIPSAAISADHLAREADFFSIGTNDLIQYTIAVDRVNDRVAHLYEPTHPSVIRLIRMTVDAGHAYGKWVGVCGEIAGDVLLTPLLIGLGVDELSTGAALVPRVKRAVQRLDTGICLELAADIKSMDNAVAIAARCEEICRRFYPELLD